jgi:ABC-type nitrate/sulfonate/bicarbonate transport system permease component
MARFTPWLAPIVGIIVFFGLWEGLLRAFRVKAFILPRPSHVLAKMFAERGFLAREALVTGREALAGLAIALLIAFVLALPMARWHVVERAIQPVATLIQVIPIVCYAPAFVIWLHPGNRPIVAVAALISIVPLLFNLVVGLRSADPATIELLRSVGASRREQLRHVQIPSALPSLFAGLRIAVGLSLVGAVLGEWFALRSHGLGVQIQTGMNTNAATLIWSSAFALGAMGGAALTLLSALERIVPGRRQER